MAVKGQPTPLVIATLAGLLAALPLAGLPDYYLSFLYLIFFWVSLSTSWGIISGTTGYWSFGHAAFYGVGVYTTATLSGKLGLPFLLTIPIAAVVAALLAAVVGFVVFRVQHLRGELFALLTLSVTFVLHTIASNTPIDGGAGVVLSNVEFPKFAGSAPAMLYILGLVLAIVAILISYWIAHSTFGMGLNAIHDDEDAAEVKGVPTLHYKMAAFAISSGIAGAVGSVQAVYVGYVTVGETFSITVPLFVVLMSILGGARHWLGPAIGAIVITVALESVAGGGRAELGKAGVALGLVVVILALPEGIVPALIKQWRRFGRRIETAPNVEAIVASAATTHSTPPLSANVSSVLLSCSDVTKSFGGIQALRGVSLDAKSGEILALVGPNGSGKSTLINTISGHYQLTSGDIRLAGRSIGRLPPHRIARLGIARTYQIPRLFDNMTVLDNVILCSLFGASETEADARREALHWLEFTGLAAHATAFPTSLTLHQRKFVEFARALAARPHLLLLDEVLCGLTPAEIDKAVALVRDIRAGGTTIVFVEHLMRVVVALADRVAVLDQGKVLAIGTPTETMGNPAVVSAYLGKAHAA